MDKKNSSQIINEIKGTTSVPGVCTICSCHCATEVFVKDNRVIYVRGNPNSANGSSLCVKGVSSIHMSRDPERLRHPLKKDSNGEFKNISWDQAFTEIAEKLAKIKEVHGPEAVSYLFHPDSNEMFSKQLFSQLYGTPNWTGHGADFDQDRRRAAMATFAHPQPTRDFGHSRFVMLWGSDPFGTNEALHESRELLKAMKKGCKLVVVDPNRSRTAGKADVWLPIKPGTDGALALAMAHRIIETEAYDKEFCDQYVHGFDAFGDHVKSNGYTPEWAEGITGINKEMIIELADEFASTKPGLMDGLEGLLNYSNGVEVFRTIYAINAITGNVDGPGNIIIKELTPLKPPIDMPSQQHLGSDMQNVPYPTRGAFFHTCDPVMSDPNRGAFKEMMDALDISVTIDMYLSETAQLSDYVLPECSMFEQAEVLEGICSGPQIIVSQPAIKPLGSSKPFYDIMQGLAEKMGYGQYYQWNTWEDWAKKVLADVPVPLKVLKEKGVWEEELRYHKFKENPLETPTNKIEIFSEGFQSMGVGPLPVFTKEDYVKLDQDDSFQLVNAKKQCHCNGHTQNNPYLIGIETEARVEVNPVDANRLGISDEDQVALASPLEEVTIKCRVSEGIRPGVLKVIHWHGFPGIMGSNDNEHKVSVRKL